MELGDVVRRAQGHAAVPGPEHDRREVVPGPVQAVGATTRSCSFATRSCSRRSAWSSRRQDQLKDSGRVLMRFNDGRPALVGKQVGDGEVLLLTTSVDKDWGFFATNLTFQPFIHGAITHLIERSAAGFNRVAGEPIRWTPKELNTQLRGHRGRTARRSGSASRRAGRHEQLALTVTDTSRAGVYTIAEEGTEAGTRFAVVPDLRESETMDPLPDAADRRVARLQAGTPDERAEATAKAESVRSRNEWTVTVLLVLLLFAVGETAWAWFCGKAW